MTENARSVTTENTLIYMVIEVLIWTFWRAYLDGRINSHPATTTAIRQATVARRSTLRNYIPLHYIFPLCHETLKKEPAKKPTKNLDIF